MHIRPTIFVLAITTFVSCQNSNKQHADTNELTATQQEMLNKGWTVQKPNEDMSKEYGIMPIYGIQDNYFDITIGKGCSAAVKIMDEQTDKCIRYAYIAENTTTTIQDIPQGTYYLKLAYGSDWMELDTDSIKQGKFTRNVSYERSRDTFNFGTKNSTEHVNYQLEINVVDSKLENNFEAIPISEEDFMK